MRWGSPQWLWVLASVPLLYLAASLHERWRQRRFSEFANQELWPLIAPQVDWKARLRKARAWIIGFACLILALARPQWGKHEELVRTTGVDVVFVLDVSNSMEVEDVVPSRLKKAKHVIRSLADRLWGDRVGLVAFAGSAYFACPLTTDIGYFLEQVAAMEPRMISNQGTDLAVGLTVAKDAMERGAEESKVLKSSRAVILISDGENHEEGDLEAARKVSEAGIQLYVLGIGTDQGGPIPVRDEGGVLRGYKRGRNGEAVVSSFHPDALSKVASTGSGKYWNITPNESEVEEILRELGALNRGEREEKRVVTYEERFQIPLFVGIALLLLELSFSARKIVFWIALSFIPSLDAQADLLKRQPSIETYLENRRGMESLKEGKVDEAKKHFGRAQALDPSRPELSFNQGLIQMKEGDMDSAIQSFGSAAKEPSLAHSSLLNLGVAQAKKGDKEGAVRSYLEAIEKARERKDAIVEEKARKNIELLMQQKQDEEQQDKQKKKQEQQQQEQQQQQQKQEDEQNNQSHQDKKTQAKQGQRDFRSSKLSDEDAERVMSELSNRDRDLQSRLRKKNAKQQSNPKDW